ncbi:MAG: hypothetical protein MI924_17735 [Chloroflexales bacterium]|nr:hypothetical protein [Chloroflexales bacterium]
MIILPTTYAEWHHCITVTCKIALTKAYLHQRLQALRDPSDRMTARFRELYGAAHLERVIGWFEQAAADLTEWWAGLPPM